MQRHITLQPRHPRVVITALGVAQILAWGTSFYFPAVFAGPIVKETGWSLGFVVGGTSIGLLVAGLISPQVGRVIEKRGGRPVLLASSLFYAAGLFGIGVAPSLPVYLGAWVVVGIGMGTGLYDAVFAALGRLYGHAARGPITNLTLFGGFASTICWPLSAFMIDHIGWRDACFVYAGLHLFLALPLQMAVIRSEAKAPDANSETKAGTPEAATAPIANETLIFALLALVLSIAAGVGSIVVVHLLIFLQARGVDFAVAVSLGTLFGPAQVGARVVERLFGGRYHPIWTMIGSCTLMAAGLVLLATGFSFLPLVILIYGGGYGVSWIGRGTLPLALFGPLRFPRLMGKLAFPSLIVQALAPSAGALAIERQGANATIAALMVLALINVGLIGILWLLCRPRILIGCMTMLELRMLFFEDLSVGLTETLRKTIDASDVVGFAAVTGDRNPIHLSEHFAAKTPFGTRIAHGLYTASLISAVLGTRLPGPGAIYISQTLNFRAPVRIGDTVEVKVTVAELMPEKFRARLTCTCAVDGETVLDGEAWVKVPSAKSERPLPRI